MERSVCTAKAGTRDWTSNNANASTRTTTTYSYSKTLIVGIIQQMYNVLVFARFFISHSLTLSLNYSLTVRYFFVCLQYVITLMICLHALQNVRHSESLNYVAEERRSFLCFQIFFSSLVRNKNLCSCNLKINNVLMHFCYKFVLQCQKLYFAVMMIKMLIP